MRPGRSLFLAAVVAIALGSFPLQAQSPVATAKSNMVATVHPLATEAGLNALREGGNAVDAAVAAALTLGVVDGYNSGIGGGCFLLIRSPEGGVFAVDAREMAPGEAHRDMYLREGNVVPELARHGPLAVAVPGALAGYAEAVRNFGRLDLARLLLPAASIAENGFELPAAYARQIAATSESLHEDPGCRRIFFHADGTPYRAGERLVQADLAETYRQIAAGGTEWFYRGPFARSVEQWMAANGGIVTAVDLAGYHTVRREPLQTRYRDLVIWGFPPPSSGGLHVAQILQMLERFELARMNREDPALAAHVAGQAMQLAFADRAHWLGDPDFVNVPRGLIDTAYTASLAARIDLQRATRVPSQGQPPGADSDFFRERHTTHIAAADAEGWWVGITTTVNTTFGACVIVPGTGVVLNNQMDDFAAAPGVPNSFGLVGNEANAIQPGKRPLSSMSPTIVCRGDGHPVMTVGAAGGPKIITATLLTVVRHFDFGYGLDRSVGDPRLHHQWVPDLLMLEEGFPDEQVGRLQALGHKTSQVRSGAFACCQAILWSDELQRFEGVSDPRSGGLAAGTDGK